MAFRVNRSFGVIPGVKFRLNKRSVGLTFGKGPFHYTVNSRGRRTASAGIPGTGMYYQKGSGGVPYTRSRSASSPRAHAAAANDTFEDVAAPIASGTPVEMFATALRAKKPGLFASGAEKRLHAALLSSNLAEVEELAKSEPRVALAAHTFASMMVVGGDAASSRESELHLIAALSLGLPEDDPFISKYAASVACSLGVTPQLSVSLPLSRVLLVLLYIENLQEQKRFDDAAKYLESEPVNSFVTLSKAELFVSMERWDDIITLTTGIENTDDFSALMLTYRGIAFREQGFFDAAREAFADALRSKQRSVEIRHLSLFARAQAAIDQNHHAAARKDLEKILNEDPDYPGLRDEIAKLRGSEPAATTEPSESVAESSGSKDL
ncbi:MAG: DUF4236 domain-containing protein [Actinomycetes bacterium]